MNSTLRGFLIILAVAAAVTALQLQVALSAVLFVLRILFLIAVGFLLYRLWRNNRTEIGTWPTRARVVFYGAALLAMVDVGLAFVTNFPRGGAEAAVFFAVLVACAFAMIRVWRDQHSYGY
ncbi:MAG TPA: hypothetical protein VHK22_02500 [Gaiellaceae bacterium]|jgi:hypothetical protein|nr:hypothetical protein [Gaiellaceae bacterium]